MCIMLHGIHVQTPAGQLCPPERSHLLTPWRFATEMRALDTPIDVIALLMEAADVRVTEYYFGSRRPAKL